MQKSFDPSAIGSDVPRSKKQHYLRKFSKFFVNFVGLNKPGPLSTEIVQQIQPVIKIPTKKGDLLCKIDHGRLLWRANTFYIEEPETINWLDTLKKEDVLWDVGANVGLFSIYAAKVSGCKVYAFEPESQNYASLVENIALNDLGDLCFPAALAINDSSKIGQLNVRYITKSGAYNLFETDERKDYTPESIKSVGGKENCVVKQLTYGVSIDDLINKHGLTPPSHIKIDVDSIEYFIIKGADKTLDSEQVKSVLVEVNRRSEYDLKIPEILKEKGFKLVSERSNWISREDRTKEQEYPATNMIFSR